jgi:hypothetical protein
VTFSSDAWFSGVTFQRDTSFARVTFRRDASFNEATFQQTRQLGPMLVRKRLRLDQASFHERIQVEVAAAAVFCRRTRFLGGVQLRVRWAQVVLDDADLAAPSILTGVPPFAGLDEGRWARAMERLLPQPLLEPDRRWKPCLLSLHRADVAGLTVATTDLRSCQFADALNLDKVRIETVRAFAHTPRGWRWTARQALAEEHHWRHHRVTSRQPPERPMATARDARPQGDPDRSWWPPACRPPSWAASAPLTPTRIASIYRALRKGREDHKDEPGAADFYYGEMEMRRHAQRQDATAQRKRRHYGAWAVATTEYMVLWLYWVTCGYALKAWRALATLAVVVLLAGGVFAWWGFASPAEPDIRPVAVDAQGRPIYARQPVERPAGLDELPDAIRFSAQAATALLRGPDRPLTAYGEWLHLALRLVGPVLLGLAVLSIRGRVKR